MEKKQFQISLPVQGYLDSLGNSTLISHVEGTTTIISILPEGTMVQKDDVVCQLDSAALREKAQQQQITATQADSKALQAKETLDITITQNQSDIAAAQLKLDLANLDLTKYKDGEYPQQVKELQGNVAIAKEERVRAEDNYEFTKQQVKKGNKTQSDMEANRIASKQAKLKLEGAEEKLKVLEKYDYERKIKELSANADELVRELERVKLKARSAETQATKDHEAQTLTSTVEQEKYVRLNKQVEACVMKAPQAGQVVYAVNKNARGGGDQIEAGAIVRERQAIINMPDVSQMKVDCRIHESMIGNIRLGLPARIRIDAFHNEVFNGVISDVSSVPIPGRWPNMDLKEYEAEIKLLDSYDIIKKLRPGLTAQVEIMVDSREDVLQVPLTAVLALSDKQVAFVLTGQGEERRDLEVGASNLAHVEVKSGLKEGELVIMNARSQFPEKVAAIETELNMEKAKRAASEKPPAIPAPVPGAAPTGAAPGGPTAGGGPPGEGGPGGGRGQGGGGGFDRGAFFTGMDKNGDGKLSGDEIDERMQSRLTEIDKDKDGAISKEEFLSAPRGNRGGGGGGAGGPGAGGEGRPRGEGRPAGGAPGGN